MNKYSHLLEKALAKQNELLLDERWKNELLKLAPPILWFGDMNNVKDKVVTIGANPSRSEFLNENNRTTKTKSIEELRYLENDKKRFFIFEQNESLNKLSFSSMEKIIESYNSYFNKEPYRQWFGSENGGKVEGLVKGFDASFYNSAKYQAIHLDLFPFATINNYKKIQKLADESLFQNGWAKGFLEDLIQNISPRIIIVFGISNFSVFKSLYQNDINTLHEGVFCSNNKKTKYSINEFKNMQLIGLNQNFGNTNFSKEELIILGKEIQNNILK